MKNNKKNGYSVVIALLLIGFIMVLSIGIFRLVLNEMKNNRAMGDYIKAYAGAESSQELALLDIKKKGYGYYNKLDLTINDKSVIISKNPLDKDLYNPKKDVLISYDNDGKVNSYLGDLPPLGYDIIPLFYIDDLNEHKVNNILFDVLTGNETDLSWNIIGKIDGISGNGDSLTGIKKTYTSLGFSYEEKTLNEFINTSDTNYLVLFNSGNSSNITYKISSVDPIEFFTKPRIDIISTGEIGDYKQNLKTRLDNTEFLSILKYSIYSN
ncbi:MAG: hypothetical protein PHI37_03020 [Candidatus Gracilibacteria bacterium]|nr:hypothetical protein [Candidatus Gracilibacteria bacterium]